MCRDNMYGEEKSSDSLQWLNFCDNPSSFQLIFKHYIINIYKLTRHGIFPVLTFVRTLFLFVFLSMIKDFFPKYDFPVIFPRSIPCLINRDLQHYFIRYKCLISNIFNRKLIPSLPVSKFKVILWNLYLFEWVLSINVKATSVISTGHD